MPRNACVIQITPVRLTRTTANDASVVRKIYLSIDPIVTARSPPSRTGTAAGDQSRNRDPPWSRRHRPAGSLSHYHPFDPSTKWLRHGTLQIWLIIRGYVAFRPLERLAARPLTGHSAPDHALDGRIAAEENIRSTARRVPDPATALIFGGFAYARRRQGRLRSVFQRPARHSGGILRRNAEIRRRRPAKRWARRPIWSSAPLQPTSSRERAAPRSIFWRRRASRSSRLIVVGTGKLSALKDNDFLKFGGAIGRQAARRQRRRDGHRGIADGRDEAGSGGRDRIGHPAARL